MKPRKNGNGQEKFRIKKKSKKKIQKKIQKNLFGKKIIRTFA